MPRNRPNHVHTSSDSSEGKIYVSQTRWREIQEIAYASTRAETRKLMLSHFTYWDRKVKQESSDPASLPYSEVETWLMSLPSSSDLYVDLLEADWLNNGEICGISFPYETLPTRLIYEQTSRAIRAEQLRELTEWGKRAGTAPRAPPIVLRNDGNLYVHVGTAGLWERFHPLSPPPPLPPTPKSKKWPHKWAGITKWFQRRAPSSPSSPTEDPTIHLARLERFSKMREHAAAAALAANDTPYPALLSDSNASLSLKKYNKWRVRPSKHGVPVLANSRRELCACHICWPTQTARRHSWDGARALLVEQEGEKGVKILRRWSFGGE